MKNLLIGFLLAFTPLKDQDYCNARFQFCITYPANFEGLGESTNGDGQTFESDDKKATILAWGSLIADPEFQSLDKEFKMTSESLKVAYKVKKANYYIISGTNKKGNIVYQKTVYKKINYSGDTNDADTEVLQSIRIEYPASQQAQYAPYCTYIAKALI